MGSTVAATAAAKDVNGSISLNEEKFNFLINFRYRKDIFECILSGQLNKLYGFSVLCRLRCLLKKVG